MRSRRTEIAARASSITCSHIRERFIGAILLGNNLANIAASALATSLFLHLFGEAGVVYATIVMTVIVVLFAEVLPKTYAILNADRMALAVAPVVRLLVAVLAPVTAAIQWIVRHTLASVRPVDQRRCRGAVGA